MAAANSVTPSPALATNANTGTPNAADNPFRSISWPFSAATSTMFNATKVGYPSSITCVA